MFTRTKHYPSELSRRALTKSKPVPWEVLGMILGAIALAIILSVFLDDIVPPNYYRRTPHLKADYKYSYPPIPPGGPKR